MKNKSIISVLLFGASFCFASNNEKEIIIFNNDIATHYIPSTVAFITTEAGTIDFGLFASLPSLPGLIQHIQEIPCEEKDSFKLDNESKWTSSKVEMLKNWEGAELVLTQNHAIFSTCPFALVNPHLQKALPVSLLTEPLPAEDKTFFIQNIDLPNDLIILTNNTKWAVHPSDHGTLRMFSPHDRIILGINSSDSYDSLNPEKYKRYILINTTNNSYVRSNFFN